LSGVSLSQTKLIAHKSHSGSSSTFSKALRSKLFDRGDSNFGMAPNPNIKYAVLDSVIIISDSQAVMVTSDYCKGPMYFQETDDSQEHKAEIWRAGKDTITNHPLFKKEYKIDSIKRVVQMKYWFKSADEVIFVGFDEQKRDSVINKKLEDSELIDSSEGQEENFIPVIKDDSNDGTFQNWMVLILLVISSWFASRVFVLRSKA
jgi:hypothetical protein